MVQITSGLGFWQTMVRALDTIDEESIMVSMDIWVKRGTDDVARINYTVPAKKAVILDNIEEILIGFGDFPFEEGDEVWLSFDQNYFPDTVGEDAWLLYIHVPKKSFIRRIFEYFKNP